MKKKLLIIISLFILLTPIFAFAENKNAEETKYNVMNLEETLNAEEITPKYNSYKETDDQVTIYLFRGNGCGYCRAFLEFLNNITEEYGKYFKLESYEVWQNSENNALMAEVANFLDKDAGGVPFIIIGEQVFSGYSEIFDEEIKVAIKTLYESKNRYDVFEEMEKAKVKAVIKGILSTYVPLITLVLAIALFFRVHYVNKSLNQKITELEDKISKINEKKEIKEVKKETTKKKAEKTSKTKKKATKE